MTEGEAMRVLPMVLGRVFPAMLSMLFVLSLSGCGGDTADSGLAETSGQSRNLTPYSSQGAQDSAVKGVAALGLDLLAAQEGNAVVAPFSASVSLARLQGGASGETATELIALSHLTGAATELYPSLNQLALGIDSRLATASLDAKTSGTESIALTQARYGYRLSYLDLLAEHFGLKPQRVDFDRALGEATQLLDNWTAQNSGLPTSVSLSSDTRFVLGEKVRLHASWSNPFNPELTQVSGFLPEGAISPVSVPFMRTTAVLPQTMGDGFTAVALPLQGNQQFLVLLPDSGRFNEIQSSLTPERLNQIALGLSPAQVEVALPKFTIQNIRSVPVGLASTKFADFSQLDGSKDLYVADAVHNTKLVATEAGIHAESTTLFALDDATPESWTGFEDYAGFILTDTSYSSIPIILGRPFIFAVRDQITGTILFLGRFTNPQL
jgi:serpin B